MIGHLMICNEGPIQMSGRHDQVMAAFKKAIAECPADEVDVAFAGRDKLRYGDSSQRGDETTGLTPIPNSRVGFLSVLNNRCAASTLVAQRSSQRATRKSTRAANRS